MSITVIGDVHGKYEEYYEIAQNSNTDYTIQLGDFGFSDTWNKLMWSDLDPCYNLVAGGNHDSYDFNYGVPHYLGKYGPFFKDGKNCFFISGGISIDRLYRQIEHINGGPKTYWIEEELRFDQMLDCLKMYELIRPDYVFSHVPPNQFVQKVLDPYDARILIKYNFPKDFKENTGLLGDEMLKIHKPKLWVSGHLHRFYEEETDGFKFVCLPELGVYVIE